MQVPSTEISEAEKTLLAEEERLAEEKAAAEEAEQKRLAAELVKQEEEREKAGVAKDAAEKSQVETVGSSRSHGELEPLGHVGRGSSLSASSNDCPPPLVAADTIQPNVEHHDQNAAEFVDAKNGKLAPAISSVDPEKSGSATNSDKGESRASSHPMSQGRSAAAPVASVDGAQVLGIDAVAVVEDEVVVTTGCTVKHSESGPGNAKQLLSSQNDCTPPLPPHPDENQTDLAQEIQIIPQQEVVMEMTLNMQFSEVQGRESEVKQELKRDMAQALHFYLDGGSPDKIEVLSLRAGSVIAEVVLSPGVLEGHTPMDAALELKRQLLDPSSLLMEGNYTKMLIRLEVLEPNSDDSIDTGRSNMTGKEDSDGDGLPPLMLSARGQPKSTVKSAAEAPHHSTPPTRKIAVSGAAPDEASVEENFASAASAANEPLLQPLQFPTSMSGFSMPGFVMPDLSKMEMPEVKIPDMPKMEMPQMRLSELPTFEMPNVPEMGAFGTDGIGIPTLPSFVWDKQGSSTIPAQKSSSKEAMSDKPSDSLVPEPTAVKDPPHDRVQKILERARALHADSEEEMNIGAVAKAAEKEAAIVISNTPRLPPFGSRRRDVTRGMTNGEKSLEQNALNPSLLQSNVKTGLLGALFSDRRAMRQNLPRRETSKNIGGAKASDALKRDGRIENMQLESSSPLESPVSGTLNFLLTGSPLKPAALEAMKAKRRYQEARVETESKPMPAADIPKAESSTSTKPLSEDVQIQTSSSGSAAQGLHKGKQEGIHLSCVSPVTTFHAGSLEATDNNQTKAERQSSKTDFVAEAAMEQSEEDADEASVSKNCDSAAPAKEPLLQQMQFSTMSGWNMPTFLMPGKIDMPSMRMTEISGMQVPDLSKMQMPEVKIPDIPEIEIPQMKLSDLPTFEIPNVREFGTDGTKSPSLPSSSTSNLFSMLQEATAPIFAEPKPKAQITTAEMKHEHDNTTSAWAKQVHEQMNSTAKVYGALNSGVIDDAEAVVRARRLAQVKPDQQSNKASPRWDVSASERGGFSFDSARSKASRSSLDVIESATIYLEERRKRRSATRITDDPVAAKDSAHVDVAEPNLPTSGEGSKGRDQDVRNVCLHDLHQSTPAMRAAPQRAPIPKHSEVVERFGLIDRSTIPLMEMTGAPGTPLTPAQQTEFQHIWSEATTGKTAGDDIQADAGEQNSMHEPPQSKVVEREDGRPLDTQRLLQKISEEDREDTVKRFIRSRQAGGGGAARDAFSVDELKVFVQAWKPEQAIRKVSSGSAEYKAEAIVWKHEVENNSKPNPHWGEIDHDERGYIVY